MHVLSLVSDTLAAEGHIVQTALDGAHALQKIATMERRFDVMIVDARMPNLDGRNFLVQVKAGGYKGKIIIFSAHLDKDERERYRALNVHRFIEKPPRSGELVGALQEIAARAA